MQRRTNDSEGESLGERAKAHPRREGANHRPAREPAGGHTRDPENDDGEAVGLAMHQHYDSGAAEDDNEERSSDIPKCDGQGRQAYRLQGVAALPTKTSRNGVSF